MTPWPSDLAARAARVRDAYRACRLCPRDCGVDRLAGADGFCRLGADAPCYKALLSHGEEAVLTPTVLLDLGGCSLRCLGCTEWDHVVEPAGHGAVPLRPGWLGKRLERWVTAGARSISVVGGEPTMHLLGVLETFAALPAALQLPVVWNTNGLLAPDAFALLADWVDCWVVDHKTPSNEAARRLLGSGNLDYVGEVEATLDAIAALPPTTGTLPRLVVRHLLVPGEIERATLPLLQRAADRWPEARWNLMTQWLPHGPALRQGAGTDALRRTLDADEKARAIEAGRRLLGDRLWIDGR
ncbi:MAG: hypothetical protein RIT45_291 [Pseudomonadota bacterium]|jgi:putative pyruvate formate lyase activating enzyme